MKYVIKQHKSAKVCDTSMLCIYQHLGVCTHIYKKHLIPSSLLSTHFLFLPSVVWSRAIRLSFFPFHWHPTVSFLFFIASCLTLTSRPLSLFCFFPPSSLLLFFHHFFFPWPSPSFLRPCELTLHNGALINEGLCPAMIAPMGWHHVTQSFLHITEGKGRMPPASSITPQMYRTV